MGGILECQLCPKYCRILPGGSGDCRIRMNVDGRIAAVTWGRPCSVHLDPIEKKPLFHFLPGSRILSLATVGCNLHCRGCQNATISQAWPEEVEAFELEPEDLVRVAGEQASVSVAYTYTEPLVYYEYTLDCARKVRDAGLKNVLVSAGYINEAPLRKLAPHLDGANVDLKAFDNGFYRDYCDATLQPVLRSLEVLKEEGVWLEITNLVVPTLNDNPDLVTRMCRWIREALGPDVPLHFSRFRPMHQMRNLPVTPGETLERCRSIARAEGLNFVYVGNLRTRDGEDTFCPRETCPRHRLPLVSRSGFTVKTNLLGPDGLCPDCGTAVPGVWR